MTLFKGIVSCLCVITQNLFRTALSSLGFSICIGQDGREFLETVAQTNQEDTKLEETDLE